MCKLGKLRVETWAQQKAFFLQLFFKFFQIDLGEEFTGPKLFRPEVYQAYASSKLCKFIFTKDIVLLDRNSWTLSLSNSKHQKQFFSNFLSSSFSENFLVFRLFGSSESPVQNFGNSGRKSAEK